MLKMTKKCCALLLQHFMIPCNTCCVIRLIEKKNRCDNWCHFGQNGNQLSVWNNFIFNYNVTHMMLFCTKKTHQILNVRYPLLSLAPLLLWQWFAKCPSYAILIQNEIYKCKYHEWLGKYSSINILKSLYTYTNIKKNAKLWGNSELTVNWLLSPICQSQSCRQYRGL